MITKDMVLPPMEKLDLPEIKLGTSSLLAGSFYLGKYCQTPNDEFMLCKKEYDDPRKCLDEGIEVRDCSIKFFKEVKKSCLEEFEQYARCIDRSSKFLSLAPCRKTQGVFDECMLDNLGLERPDFAYYCRPRIVHTERPKPEGYKSPEFPGHAVDPVFEDGRTGSKYGSRSFGMF